MSSVLVRSKPGSKSEDDGPLQQWLYPRLDRQDDGQLQEPCGLVFRRSKGYSAEECKIENPHGIVDTSDNS